MESLTFHESTVNQLTVLETKITLQFDDVLTNSGKLVSVEFQITSPHHIFVESESRNTIEFPDLLGEVLTLNHKESKLELFIEWHDFKNKKHFVHHYELQGDITFKILQ